MAKNRCVRVHIYVEVFKFYIDSDHIVIPGTYLQSSPFCKVHCEP